MSLKRLDELLAEQNIIKTRLDAIEAETEKDDGGDEVARAKLVTDLDAESDELIARHKALEVEKGPLIKRANDLKAIREAAKDIARTEPGDGSRYLGGRAPNFSPTVDPFDCDPRVLSSNEVISRAMSAVDRERHIPFTDSAKSHLESLIHRSYNEEEEGGQFDGSYIARRTLYTENPIYRSAFRKYVRFGYGAHFNEREAQAIARFQEYELRRAAGEVTTTAGGFGVPVKLAA